MNFAVLKLLQVTKNDSFAQLRRESGKRGLHLRAEFAEEYLFVWASFLGWIIAARRRSHLTIDMLTMKLPPRGGAALRAIGALCGIAFAGLLVWYGWRIAARNLDVDTTTLFFSQGVVYAIVPIAALAVGLYALADLRAALRAFAEVRA